MFKNSHLVHYILEKSIKAAHSEASSKSACTNTEMNESVQVFSSWMMNKVMLYKDVYSLLTPRKHLSECKITFGSQRRGIPKGGRR